YEHRGSSVLRLIHLSSRAKIHVSESVYGMLEAKNSCPRWNRVHIPRVVTAIQFKIFKNFRPNSFTAIPPAAEHVKALRIPLSLSEGKSPRRSAQDARSTKFLEWAA